MIVVNVIIAGRYKMLLKDLKEGPVEIPPKTPMAVLSSLICYIFMRTFK